MKIQKKIKRDAFTLLELMIVIVIIGVISAIMIPSFVSFKGTELRVKAKQISGLILYARTRAISEKTLYKVYFDKYHNICFLDKGKDITFSSARDLAERGDETVLYIKAPYEILFIKPNNKEDILKREIPNMEFYYTGSSSGGTVVISDTEKIVFIAVDIFTGEPLIKGPYDIKTLKEKTGV